MNDGMVSQAFALCADGRVAESLALAESLMANAGPNAALLNLAAICAMQAGDLAKASSYWQPLLEGERPDPAVLNLAAVCHMALDHPVEAQSLWEQALAIQPDHADALYNLGHLLQTMHRFEAAEAAYRQLLTHHPDHANGHYALGLFLYRRKRFAEAEEAYQRALQIQPDHEEAQWYLGVLYLSLGRFQAGWPLYEARHPPNRPERVAALIDSGSPRWNGEPLAGRSLLLVAEQGLGDQIQFCRYAATLKARGVTQLTLVCAAPLETLFAALAGVDRVLVQSETRRYPPHDFWAFYLSIPFHLATTLETIPNRIPYLMAPEARLAHWKGRLPPDGFRVGLVWKGNLQNRKGLHRSLPGLHLLAPLWSVPGITFISLQKGEGEEDARNAPPEQPLLPLGETIRDCADTAAIVAQLDLVISIDSAVAHLAGAVGKPCWILLPHWGTDWRWLHDRSDSPWYPGMVRLFRQTRPDDWPGVIQQVTEALADRVQTTRPSANP